MMKQIAIYDTTLYGSRTWTSVPLTISQKFEVLNRLDRLGVSFIEVGPLDRHEQSFIDELQNRQLDHARLVIFSPGDSGQPESQKHLDAMLATGIQVCTIAGESWSAGLSSEDGMLDLHLKLIKRNIALLKKQGRDVVYDARNFFEGFKDDPEYTLATLTAAVEGGATTIMLCDNAGLSLPWEAGKIVHYVQPLLQSVSLGIHMHNDRDCAVANSVAASTQGADQVRGALNGLGARSGRANLCNIIPDLELKMGFDCLKAGSLPDLVDVSKFLAGLSGLTAPELMPYVGKSDFAPV